MKRTWRSSSLLRRTFHVTFALACLAGIAMLAPAWKVEAGSSGDTEIYFPQGEDSLPANGDFITSDGTTGDGDPALDTFYSYFIEVPSGLSRLVIELFDADIGVGGTTEQNDQRDRARAGFNSTMSYSLLDPSGIVQAIEDAASVTDQPGGADDAWMSILDTNFPAFAGSASAVNAANVTSLSVAKPANTQANDLLIFIVAIDGDSNNSAINTPTGGTGGWTLVNEGGCAGAGGGACRLGVWRRIALAGDPATYSVTWTGSEEVTGVILRYTGVSTATPIDISSSGTGTSTTPTAPTATTTVANTRVLRIYAADNDVTAIADDNPYPTGLRGRFNLASSATDADAVTSGAAETLQATAGATGAVSFEIDDSQEWRAVTVAIRPDSGNAANGHWELRMDPGPGDDLLATGLRAHDGTSGSGGTEINVYYDSHNQFGVNPNTAGDDLTKDYDVFTYVTSGCTFSHNDFDYDSNQANNIGNVEYTSRGGTFSQLFDNDTLATDDVWQRDTIPRWTTDGLSTDYGIWRTEVQIRTYADGGSGNYTNVYVGNFNVGANPPTQPMSNVFRVYLPTDASDTTAPVKPYLEQLLTYVSGPNPPLVGQTTRVYVTVRLVNPTAQAITFSTPTNIVTANVPGPSPAVVYRGNAVFTQGSIVSQPALGGTGNVTWNPGTVAAGQTVILAYQVDVTPTSAGQRLVVTGTPASNGTRCTFVDQTGNTSQSRATFTLGPICELAATQGVITHALLKRFEGYSDGGRRVLLWETGSEIGTLGFEVHRLDPASGAYRRLGDLLPALEAAPAGGRYRFVDEGVGARERATYVLVEVDTRGNRRSFGPYTVDGASDVRRDDLSALDGSFLAEAHPTSPRLTARLAQHAAEKRAAQVSASQSAKAGGATAVKIGIAADGLHWVSAAEIGAALGTPEATVRQWIAEGRLRLTLESRQISWLAAPGNAGLYFYGRAPESLFSRENVYRLENKDGLQMATVDLTPRGLAMPVAPPSTFEAALHLEQDRFAATVLPLDPASDYWFWEGVLAGHPTLGSKSFHLAVPAARPTAGEATLAVGFQGATDLGIAGEHEAGVRLNGVELGTTAWQGIAAHEASFSFPSSLLADGDNLVEITGTLPPGVATSAFYVDAFDLVYPRAYTALGDALLATGDGRPAVRVAGFGSAAIRVFDVSQPNRPKVGKGVVIDAEGGDFRASFRTIGAGTPYFAVAAGGVLAPASLAGDAPSSLKAASNRADYVVIAPAELAGAAAALADYRAALGYRTLVVDLEDVYDEFSFSQPSPAAVRDFLRHAYQSWATPPRYAVLAGDGSFDYRDLLGLGGNLVPPVMVATGHGLFSSDSRYGDVAGDDGVPEIAVGRLPVLTSAELSSYVARLAAYEAGGSRSDLVALVADDPDQAADFGAQSQSLAATFEQSFVADELFLGTLTATTLRERLLADIGTGVGLVSFVGHGGPLGLADEELLAPADVPNLGNGSKLFTLTGLTCALNRFELPGVSGLAEELLTTDDGGAAAVWAPSGLSQHSEAALLGEAFYRALAGPGPETGPGSFVLGDAVRAALASYAATGATSDLLAIYNLMGDPALSMQLERRSPPPGPPAGGSGE